MATDPRKRQPTTPPRETENLEGDIRVRAFELYEERGREDGRDVEDWLRAEEEVTKKKIHAIA